MEKENIHHTTKVISFLNDYCELIEDEEILTTDEYHQELFDVIMDSKDTGDNHLMTQKELFEYYDSDCKSLIDVISQMEGHVSKDYIEGFKFAIELFEDRKRIGL